MEALHNLLLNQEYNLSAKNQQLIVEDLDEFRNTTLKQLIQGMLVLLSQSVWNTDIHIAYRKAGYCMAGSITFQPIPQFSNDNLIALIVVRRDSLSLGARKNF